MIRKFAKIFNNFFSNVVSDLKYLTTVIIFHEKKTYSVSTVIETFEKHPSILNIKQRNPLFSFFIQKDYSREGIESYRRFKHKKKSDK